MGETSVEKEYKIYAAVLISNFNLEFRYYFPFLDAMLLPHASFLLEILQAMLIIMAFNIFDDTFATLWLQNPCALCISEACNSLFSSLFCSLVV